MIDFWKDFDGTNSDSIPHLRVDVNKPSWWHGSWEYSGLDVERIKAYCKATGKEYEKQSINAKFMNEMEEWYLNLAEQYSVFNKIIADIDKKAQHFLGLHNNQRVNGLEDALDIIEKHRK